MKKFSEYLIEQFPGMTKETEVAYLRKNKNGRKKGGIMPRPSVKHMKGIAGKSTGKRADSFFY